MKRFFQLIVKIRLALSIAFIFVCWLPTATWASSIDPGFDLFQTPADGNSTVDLTGVGLGIIPLQGAPELLNPPGNLGNTDTIVERIQGIDPFQQCPPGPHPCTGVIDIELVALSLRSIDPVDLTPLGGPFIGVLSDLYVTLDKDDQFGNLPQPDALDPSIGRMEVTHGGVNGGTFDACLGDILDCANLLGILDGGIFADAIFTILAGDPNNPLDILHNQPAPKVILESACDWSHTAPAGDAHTATYPAGQFYVESCVHTGPHQPIIATPIPAAVWLFGSALGLLGWLKRKAA